MPGTDMSLEQLKEYRGSYPRPADFDAHWEKVRGELEHFPFTVKEEKKEMGVKGLSCRWLSLVAPDGCVLWAKYICPDKGGRFPVVVQFHDYPLAARSWFHLSRYLAAGFAVLAPDCRGQGGRSESGRPGRGSTAFGPMFNGIEDEKENMYLHHLIQDALLWVLAAKTLKDVDEEQLTVYGEGQGAGLALACAALVKEVKKCGAHYPMLCDYYRVWEMDFDNNAYEGLGYYFRCKDPLHEREKEVFEKLAYVDVKNFAPMVRGKVLMSTGLQDMVSPPSAQFAIYNGLTCSRQHLVYPKHGHELNNFFENAWLAFLISQ